jgi:hypothetical protein
MADQTGSLASVLKAAGSREGSSDVLFTKHAVGSHVSICDGIKAAQSCSLPLHWVLGLLIHEISRERVPVCGLRYGSTAAIIFGIYRHLPHGCRGYGRLPVLGADICYASVSVKVRV